MYLDSFNKYTCSGCTACKAVCMQNAISMVKDEDGFLYPEINEIKCINCGLCKEACPNIRKSSNNNILEVYGVKHKNESERKTSRSGGVFVAISDYILEQGGIIYGAKLDDDFSVSHR